MTQYSRSSSEGPDRGAEKEKRRSYGNISPQNNGDRRGMSHDRRKSHQNDRRSYRRSPHSKRYPDKIPPGRKLFVTNIDGKYSEDQVKDDVRKQFGLFGEIKQIIVKTKQHSSNTYVFVEFEHLDDSIKAQEEMKGKLFKGKELKVEFGKGQRKHDDRQSGQCYFCHRDGHYARDCRDRDRERDRGGDRDRYRGRDRDRGYDRDGEAYRYEYDRKRRSRSRSREKHHYRRPRHSRSSSSSRKSYRRRRSYSRDRDRDYNRKRDYGREKDHYYSRNYDRS